ncbi:esterase/lipase family protein [Pleionea sediminis]|uniref:esterase/lipase family protein n=1 Tax=Pleionea sediminis TaxID=2569479 RepID=UPI00118621EF|nr:hypothetical protein [Pleionea sediminis]
MRSKLVAGVLPFVFAMASQSSMAGIDCQIPKQALNNDVKVEVKRSFPTYPTFPSFPNPGCDFDPPIEPPIEPPGDNDDGTISYSGVTIHQNISGALDKPVILVEGFDPMNQTSATELYNQMPYYLKENLRNSGRDVITVSFNDNGDSLRTNANHLKTLINWVNAQKEGNHSNAVFGLSMGGVVSRIALKEMENAGVDHQTGLYISFDSPHRGAYVPSDIKPTLNRMLEKISKYVPSSSDKNEAKRMLRNSLKLVDSPAAREMLVTSGYSSPFYAYLDSLGYPNNTVRVAYSMGSESGYDNGHSDDPTNDLMRFRIEVYQFQNYRFTVETGDCYLPCDRLNGHYVNNAGSTRDVVRYMDEQISLHDKASVIDYDRYEIDRRDTGFIPVYSALDMKHIALSTPYSDSLQKHSPFDVIHFINNQNLRHDETGIRYAIGKSISSITNLLNTYHIDSPIMPSREDKVAPLPSVANVESQWLISGTNTISWSRVPGATHYQMFFNNYTYPVKTLTATTTRIQVGSDTEVKVRACNETMCSYPSSTTAYYRPNSTHF